MRVSLSKRLSILTAINSPDIYNLFADIAAVLNGGVDASNFGGKVNIGVANKEAPRSWFVLDGQLTHPFKGDGTNGLSYETDQGPNSLRWKIPANAPSNRSGTMKIGGWSATFMGTELTSASALTGGTVKLSHVPISTGIENILYTHNIVNPTNVGAMFGNLVTEHQVDPGDEIRVIVKDVTFSGGATRIVGFAASVWLRMPHLP